MHLFLDSKPVSAFSKRQMRDVLAKARADTVIEAVVLGLDAADARVTRAARWLYGGFSAVVALLLGGLMATYFVDGSGLDGAIVVPVAIVVTLACFLMLRWAYLRGLRHWGAERNERAAAMSAPGTRLRADPHGLAIGGARASWAALTVEKLYLNQITSGDDTVYAVERLSLVDGERRFMIDRDLISEGSAIAHLAYAKLIAERGIVELTSEGV
jgi:hypothetical protein